MGVVLRSRMAVYTSTSSVRSRLAATLFKKKLQSEVQRYRDDLGGCFGGLLCRARESLAPIMSIAFARDGVHRLRRVGKLTLRTLWITGHGFP